jgi:hypothetical protein
MTHIVSQISELLLSGVGSSGDIAIIVYSNVFSQINHVDQRDFNMCQYNSSVSYRCDILNNTILKAYKTVGMASINNLCPRHPA